ncbi:glutamate cyclase domain-containing protein [Pseudochelatococcus sp. B33]
MDGASAAEAPNLLAEMIGDSIDRLVNLDISGYGVIDHLHAAARMLCGRPVSQEAALRLRQRVGKGDYFFVSAGWILPGFYPYGETDGPIGAATLGRSLGLAFGARMVLLTEPTLVGMMTSTCRAAGLNVITEADLEQASRPPHPQNLYCIVLPFPIDEESAVSEAARLFDRYQPKAIIAVEKNGPNHKGRYSMVDGSDNSDCVAKAARLFEEAARRGVLTIGIGDRGNEIGFGAIAEVPRHILPFGEDATDTTVVDVLVTAAVSNWGASAIAANLAVLLDNPELLHNPRTEARMLESCIAAGGIDGFMCRPVPFTDGMTADTHVAVNTLLNEMVRAPAARLPSLFSTPTHRR